MPQPYLPMEIVMFRKKNRQIVAVGVLCMAVLIDNGGNGRADEVKPLAMLKGHKDTVTLLALSPGEN